jgi:branched-chain amino acid transport system substrate-binding protein
MFVARGKGRRSLIALAAVAACAVGAFGCGSSDGGSSQGASDGGKASESKEPIKIGVVKGFTGFMSAFDNPVTDAIQFAVDDINADGGVNGRKLELIKVDMQTQPQEAQRAATEAIGKGAEFIITSCDFDNGAPAALAAAAKDLVAFSDCAGSPQFGKQGIGPLAFTMGMLGPTEGAAWAQWAKSRDYKRAYLLEDTSLIYHKQTAAGFVQAWEKVGELAGRDTFANDDASVSAQVNRLRSTPNVDFIALASRPPGGAGVIKQIRAAGIDLPIITDQAFDGDTWKKAVPNLSNVYLSSYASLAGDDPDPEVNKFVERYAAKAGGVADGKSLIVTGYSVMQAFKLAAEKCDCISGEPLAKAFESLNDAPLLIGATTFTSEFHFDPQRPVKLLQIKDGKTTYLETVELTEPPDIKALL